MQRDLDRREAPYRCIAVNPYRCIALPRLGVSRGCGQSGIKDTRSLVPLPKLVAKPGLAEFVGSLEQLGEARPGSRNRRLDRDERTRAGNVQPRLSATTGPCSAAAAIAKVWA